MAASADDRAARFNDEGFGPSDRPRPIVTAADLLRTLNATGATEATQRQLVRGWLRTHEASAGLSGSLRRAGLID